MRRSPLLLAGAMLAMCPAFALSPAAADDSKLTISHVEPSGDDVQILVSVPKGTEVDLDKIAVTFDDAKATSAAAPAGDDTTNQVRRTTVLAIDTSDSMEGDRFTAAKAAAETFLDAVPEDVYVGIVSFNSQVTTEVEPTLDRDEAAAVVESLELSRGTLLHDGIISAVSVTGTEGQRSVLVLSDGLNTNKTPLSRVEKAITDAEVNVDAVALDQSGDDLAALEAVTQAGGGELIPAEPEALTQAFTDEADSLARQILVTAKIPAEVSATEATVFVTVPAGDGAPLTAKSFSIIRAADAPTVEIPSAAQDETLQIPREAMYGGLAAVGIGLLLLTGSIIVMATGGAPKSVEQRIAAFGSTSPSGPGAGNAETSASTLDQAKGAAASMLQHNRGLEARIERRLEGAGSDFKPAEWLLLHAAVAILFGLVGLVLGGGDAFLLLVFLILGITLPWLWLGRKRKKRIKAFNSGLADTLQLISGGLSAGMSLAQSLDSVVAEGSEPIAGEFKRVLIETRLGVPLEAALEGIAARIESKDFAWVVMAIRIQRAVGGNLAELLNTVAGTLRERDYLRRQVRSLSAEGRLSAYILIGLPIGMLVYMMSFRRAYVMPLFTESLGLMLSAAAVTFLGMGWFMMSRIVKVEV